MIIKNGNVFCPDRSFQKKDLLIADGIITEDLSAASSDGRVFDAYGKFIIPGLVDIHSHGAVGHDFCDASADGLREILKYEKSCGITSYCPTSMTLSKEMLLDIFKTATEIEPSEELASIAGINMEGPFISDSKKGAQNGKYITCPDTAFFNECNTASGNLIKLVTLAPEEPGSEEFIRELKDAVAISVGHTAASYDEADRAFKSGFNHVTHLCNGMPPFNHREPGVIGAAIENENVIIELICDGIHIHPAMIRTFFKLFGAERIALISDSMEATGMPDGDYELGKQHVIKKGNLATLEDGTIAGSATNLFDCMLKAIVFGITPEDAITAATATPARSIGAYPLIGSLEVGARADILVLDEKYKLVHII
ncbi:N-acetylglucosamine-6-phosphate deacetylase [Pseudobutyrivibrio xylanivorans]|uniref:N-acetylglucosamine-6-phosphate deacetylase n=1 Tax=Pseudobutyrivibrio xylanivorans TaxID=185007 RepID=A0A5P6VQC0_PSEXY|nr:N-acetylglucosamine-6-phosphate deacetylase [Pseudobutyrivibrio xylanivorans]QFJ54856.1 N-acetylglucosamine-6-phosphate deacetylase [Pseudobutyrivibrio xylanivorans]